MIIALRLCVRRLQTNSLDSVVESSLARRHWRNFPHGENAFLRLDWDQVEDFGCNRRTCKPSLLAPQMFRRGPIRDTLPRRIHYGDVGSVPLIWRCTQCSAYCLTHGRAHRFASRRSSRNRIWMTLKCQCSASHVRFWFQSERTRPPSPTMTALLPLLQLGSYRYRSQQF